MDNVRKSHIRWTSIKIVNVLYSINYVILQCFLYMKTCKLFMTVIIHNWQFKLLKFPNDLYFICFNTFVCLVVDVSNNKTVINLQNWKILYPIYKRYGHDETYWVTKLGKSKIGGSNLLTLVCNIVFTCAFAILETLVLFIYC